MGLSDMDFFALLQLDWNTFKLFCIFMWQIFLPFLTEVGHEVCAKSCPLFRESRRQHFLHLNRYVPRALSTLFTSKRAAATAAEKWSQTYFDLNQFSCDVFQVTCNCNIVACRTQIVLPAFWRGKPKYQRIPKLPPFIKPQKPQWQNKAGQEAEWRRRLIFVKNVHNYCSKRQRERKKRQIRDKFLSLSSFAPLLCFSP